MGFQVYFKGYPEFCNIEDQHKRRRCDRHIFVPYRQVRNDRKRLRRGFRHRYDGQVGEQFPRSLFGTDHTFTEGVNAIIEVNGIEIQRSSNTFTVDGVTITVSETSDTPVKINVSRDTEQIEKGIADFVNDYNALIEKLNELIRTKATYRDYPPLTAAQKAEMTEKEIELWEEKAREGLLRNDPTIYKLLQDMRSALYSRVPGRDTPFTIWASKHRAYTGITGSSS